MFGSADDFHAPLQTLFIMISNVTNINYNVRNRGKGTIH